jgi:hypothetical protein
MPRRIRADALPGDRHVEQVRPVSRVIRSTPRRSAGSSSLDLHRELESFGTVGSNHGLVELRGDKAAWKSFDAHPDRMRPGPVDRAFPCDVNTWQEYAALQGDGCAPIH